MADKMSLPCGIPVRDRVIEDPSYILTCMACGKKVDCSEHHEYLDKVARYNKCEVKELAYCCRECKEDSNATLVNPMDFGKA